MNDVVLYEIDNAIAKITLNRPNKLNAMNAKLVEELGRRVREAAEDDSVKVVLVAGAGRSFSAGFDINDEIEDGTETPRQWRPVLQKDISMTMSIWDCPKPTIAVVQGHCLAGGCEVAMACDLVVASEDAVFGEPEIQYGSGPVTLLMPFILNQRKTRELLFTGDSIDAQSALEAGLVNRVVAASDLDAAAKDLALRIAPTPLEVLRLTKQTLNRAYEAMGLRHAVNSNLEIGSLINGANTPEQQEFDAIASEKGLKAALAWRNERYDSQATS
ncbi:enoyl-CoA hydratase/isomerase family protein [Saccharopolyspora erythraea]|uniref:enoyl-CoA hydratase-related protein n=1 Tax=Saccharopolyspora erythraea TaxID=1836 RepID=UPI001BA67B7D|nr:enoyl-CoA hydratase-related protein [Saccharopolyspora erythraea]QUH04154.1 enoyl-CoA hydratase/isomerase family protein [Saccharopolyspora erythraea]